MSVFFVGILQIKLCLFRLRYDKFSKEFNKIKSDDFGQSDHFYISRNSV